MDISNTPIQSNTSNIYLTSESSNISCISAVSDTARSADLSGVSIKVMSFNLRNQNVHDGINAFSNRKKRVLDVIEQNAPDIIGFQEASCSIREWLRDELTGYSVLGCGRNADYRGEGIPLAVRNSCMEVVEYRCRWLSGTPEEAGTCYGGDQSRYPRMYIKVKIRHRDIPELFEVVNVHTDHRGVNARMLEVRQLSKELYEDGNIPIIITGDFNARPGTPEIAYMTSEENRLKLKDATAELKGTFHGFRENAGGVKIDYIFTNLDYENSYVVNDIPVNGVFVSDHRPVCSDIVFKF